MDNRDARKGHNEAFFRELNERIEEQAAVRDLTSTFEIVCECDSVSCMQRIPIAVVDYEAVREVPTRFIVAHGHLDPTVERITASKLAYDVVTKFGVAAVVAKTEDPRG